MFGLFSHVTEKMDPSKFRTIGAIVTAFKLLLLTVNALNGVVINAGILKGMVQTNSTTKPNEALALGAYTAPAIVYLVGGIISATLYTCATTCCNSRDDYNDYKVCNRVLDVVLCTLLIIGGLSYYCGNNLPTLTSGLDLNTNNLEIVMQILLFSALLFYRFIPMLLTKAKLVHRGFQDQEYFSQVALDSVALAVDTDLIFSLVVKSEPSCSNGTGGSSLAMTCPEGHIYKLLWVVYAILVTCYIGFIFLSLSFKYYQSNILKMGDFIGAIIFDVLAFLVLPLYLVADNQLPLNCEHIDDPETAITIRAVFTTLSLLFYSVAFLYQILLYVVYIHYE